jgi:hypothetical protein
LAESGPTAFEPTAEEADIVAAALLLTSLSPTRQLDGTAADRLSWIS